MTLEDAAAICHPHNRRSPLGDVLAPHAASINRACVAGYGFALHDLENHATVLRSFLRGGADAEGARLYIASAREALTLMEQALEGC